MAIAMRWVTSEDLDRVADTRLRCYASAAKHAEKYRSLIQIDPFAKPGDFLLAEEGSEAVGTTTSISFNTWVRGARLPVQGVAWVGTIRTRRRGGTGGEAGIASRLMFETLRKGREREQILSLLMPWRPSFYEKFGYGLVERRVEWTVPVSVFPAGPTSGLRFAEAEDRPAIREAYQRAVERGQCDLERSAPRWEAIWEREAVEGFEVIDRPNPAGPVLGYLSYDQILQHNKDVLRVQTHFAEDAAAFRRQLHFLAGLKDQYFAAQITLPADRPLNWLLTERQLPHRMVNHPHAEARPITRMQARVLDHRKLIEAMQLPDTAKGDLVVAIHETEKTVNRFRVTVEGGRAAVRPSESTPQVECSDVLWAAIVLGDLPAAQAVASGLLRIDDAAALAALSAFAHGPLPFCQEGF